MRLLASCGFESGRREISRKQTKSEHSPKETQTNPSTWCNTARHTRKTHQNTRSKNKNLKRKTESQVSSVSYADYIDVAGRRCESLSAKHLRMNRLAAQKITGADSSHRSTRCSAARTAVASLARNSDYTQDLFFSEHE